MLRIKLILLGCLAVLALSGATASSASAFAWWVENSKGEEVLLGKGVKQEFNKLGAVHENVVLKWGSLAVECGKIEYEKGFIEGSAILGAKSFELKSCKVNNIDCTLEELKTGEVTGEVILVGKTAGLVIKPQSGTMLGKFTLRGALCPTGEEALPLVGTFKTEIPEVEKLNKEKTLVTNTIAESGELKVGSTAASLKGKPAYSATSGWSGR